MPERKVGVLGASSLVGGCLLAQLEEMGVDPNVNVNVFDPSMSDMEWRRAAREMPR